jgi:hypothetical protein
VIFVGVFVVQWGIGLLVDAFRGAGWTEVDAFRGAFGVFLATSVLSYGWFLWSSGHNRKQPHERHPADRPCPAGQCPAAVRAACVPGVRPNVMAIDVQPNLSPEETLGTARIALDQLSRQAQIQGVWCWPTSSAPRPATLRRSWWTASARG